MPIVAAYAKACQRAKIRRRRKLNAACMRQSRSKLRQSTSKEAQCAVQRPLAQCCLLQCPLLRCPLLQCPLLQCRLLQCRLLRCCLRPAVPPYIIVQSANAEPLAKVVRPSIPIIQAHTLAQQRAKFCRKIMRISSHCRRTLRIFCSRSLR